jgi:hypothetical protein
MIEPPAEPEEPKNPERQRQRVPRVFANMSADQRQCLRGRAFNREGDRLDVPLLADRETVAQCLGPSRGLFRLGHARLKLQQAGARDMREGKIGIAFRRALQELVGADIRRQEQVDGRHILRDSLGGGRGYRQIEAVLHFPQPPVLVGAATVALLKIRQENVS